jgi:DNA recombination-dependent growth factor C
VFKNVMMYRIGEGWSPSLEQMEQALDAERFVPCGASQEKAIGWVEPRGEAHGPLVEAVSGQRILKLKIETKGVPGSIVTRKAKELSAVIEATEGRKPGKKEMKEIKEDVKMSLMPMAFSKESSILVWIDPATNLMVMDAGSQAKADELVTMLIKSFAGLSLTLINTQMSPQSAMATSLFVTKLRACCTSANTWKSYSLIAVASTLAVPVRLIVVGTLGFVFPVASAAAAWKSFASKSRDPPRRSTRSTVFAAIAMLSA